MKKTMFIIGIVLLGILVLGGVVYAASGFSWTNVENALANLIYNGEFTGLGGVHTNTSSLAAKGLKYTPMGSQEKFRTTSVYNNTGTELIIDRVTSFASTTAASVAANMHFYVATNTNVSTIDLLTSSSLAAETASWAVTGTASSLFTSNQLRRWANGSYVLCVSDLAISTTVGFCAVEYYNE